MHSLQLHCQLKAPGKGIQWLLQGAPTSQSGANGEHQSSQGPSCPEGRRWAADNHSPSHKSIICKLHRMHLSQPHCLCCGDHAKEDIPQPAAGNPNLLPDPLTSQSGAGGRPPQSPQELPCPQGLRHPQRLQSPHGQGLLCDGSLRSPLPRPCFPWHAPLPGHLPPLRSPPLQAVPASGFKYPQA